MNLCLAMCVGIGLLTVSSHAPAVESTPPDAALAGLTRSEQAVYQMTGGSWNWFQTKQLAANYVGLDTDCVIYSDWLVRP